MEEKDGRRRSEAQNIFSSLNVRQENKPRKRG